MFPVFGPMVRDLWGRLVSPVSLGSLLVLASLICLPLSPRSALAQSLELIHPSGEPYRNEEPLRLRIPPNLPGIDYSTLQIEIDQIDVTALVRVQGDLYLVTPPEPLTSGIHLLSVLAYTDEGQFVELGSWTFTVEALPTAEAALGEDLDAEFESNNALESIGRLLEEGGGRSSDRFAVSGGGGSQVEVYGEGRWRFSGAANYFLESDSSARLTDEVFDIGEHSSQLLYDGEELMAAFTAGNHDLGFDNFLASGFYRRGLSAHGGLGTGRLSGQIFTLGAESQVGARDPFGLGDRTGHVHGGAITARPFELIEDDFAITGFYYTGEEGTANSFGIEDEDFDPGEGHGWAVSFNSLWMQRRLSLNGEFARSHFDVDGNSGSLGQESSNAMALRAGYQLLQGEDLAGETMDLRLGAGWERVDTFFGSVANQGVAEDRESLFASAELAWGGFFGTLAGRDETNNVDDLSGLPTDRLRSFDFNGQYSFLLDPNDAELRELLGSPFATFGAAHSRLRRKDTPDAYAGPDSDSDLLSWYIGVGSSYDDWSWQLQHQHSSLEDRGVTDGDSDSATTDLSVFWSVTDRLGVSLGAQYSGVDDSGGDGNTVNGLIGFDAEVVPERLSLSLDYNMNLSSGDVDLPDRHLVNGELAWRLRAAEANEAGLEFALRGSFEMGDSSSDEDQSYEAFAVIRLLAPISY